MSNFKKSLNRLGVSLLSNSEWMKSHYKDQLEFYDTKRSHMPLPYSGFFLSTIRMDQIPRFLGALTDAQALDTREFKLSQLTAIQNRVDTEKVISMAVDPPTGGKPIIVVKSRGSLYIIDGHHRAVAAWLRGEETIGGKYKNLDPKTNAMKSSDSWSVGCKFVKADSEKRLVYGWASVITNKDGTPIVDTQGDIILLDTLMKSAHDFMMSTRTLGDMHKETKGIGDVVESLIVSPDIRKVMGMPEGPTGWFVGVKVRDEEVWKKVKSGQYRGFSIAGDSFRLEVNS